MLTLQATPNLPAGGKGRGGENREYTELSLLPATRNWVQIPPAERRLKGYNPPHPGTGTKEAEGRPG